ncbi:MAG: helix-turn-helix domain-containing protein [Bacteroidaceae bacterium]|nr:helix-turn-helix domain-containing protein [Bacteroidaceae bacterium]
MYRLKQRWTYIILVILALWSELPNVAVAQSQEMNYVMREDGLSGESAHKIITDHLGHVWIATSYGVTTFNGIKATLVPMRESDIQNGQNTLQEQVYDICESPTDHSIIIATETGIWQLASADDCFEPLLCGFPNARILCDKHRLYISNQTGLRIYEKNTIKEIDIKGDRNVHCMTFGPDSTVWFLTADVIGHYLPAEKRVERRVINEELPADVNFGSLIVTKDKVWLGTKNYGLFLYNIDTAELRHIDGPGNVVLNLYYDGQGHLCVATDGSGAWLLDENTGNVLRHFGTSEGSLRTNAVYYYYLDAHGNHWFGQARYGLAYTYHQEPLLEIYHHGTFSSKELNVRSFCINNNQYFLGTNQGLFSIDESTEKIHHITPSQLGGATIITSIVHYGNFYYIATYDGGIFKLNPQTHTVTPATELNKLMAFAPVKTMKRSPKDELWIGTGNGIVIVDSTGYGRLINHDNSPLMEGEVSSFIFGSDGSIWSLGSQGLAVIKADGHFIGADSFPADYFHRENHLVADMYRQEMAYFSNRNGLYYTSLDMSNYGKLPLPDGIIDEMCYDICVDTEGNKWLATEKGLFCLNEKQQSLLHLGYGEGLRSMLISREGFSQYGDTLWVATADGLFHLSIKSLNAKLQKSDYYVMLHSIYCGGLSIEKDRVVNQYRTIVLGWNFTSQPFHSKLFLNDFGKPEGRIFEYRIDDEEQWQLLRHNDDLTIARLTIGDHKLCVRLAGTPGTETTYTLRVLPTTLFYLEILLFIIAVSLFIVWWRYHKGTKLLLYERDEIEDVLVEMQREKVMESDAQETTPEEVAKYQQLKMSEEECADIVSRMQSYLNTERVFTNPDLKRADLAQVLHVPVAKLSYVFSMYLKENYYEYINRYRLDAFKQLIDEGAYKHFTLTALSEQCGFKKSSFFSTFRKVEGMTPAEYLKRKNISIRNFGDE